MKMVNAYTLEVDDPAIAVAEILEQLDKRLLSHSAGFITCSYDYVETGMVKAICEALPFEVAGCTTLSNATNGEAGTMLFCLSVLTADDCRFAAAATPPLPDDPNAVATIEATFREAAARLDGEPELVLAFLPLLSGLSAEAMLGALDSAAGGKPVFGTVACETDTTTYANAFTIRNGACSREGLSMLLVSGQVNPRFVVASISEQNMHKQYAVITSSSGNVLKQINGMSAVDYLYSIGLLQGVGLEAASSLPFVINFNDGSQPVARAIYQLSEDGSATCGGSMPQGCTLSVGHIDTEDVLLTAEQSVKKILENQHINGLFMFSCLGRNMVLGLTPMLEIEKVEGLLPDDLPWHMAYSGGEICPVYGQDHHSTVNRFHNFTFIGLAI